MVDRLRVLFKEDPKKDYYISAAPQCMVPDAQLADAITKSSFDFVFVQFYNTMSCSARDWVSHGPSSGFTFDAWANVIQNSANPDAKLFIGLPASADAAIAGYYLTPGEVKPLVKKYMKKHPDTFGGVMLWEATASEQNGDSAGKSYAGNVKEILEDCLHAGTSSTASSSTGKTTSTGKPSSTGWNGTASSTTWAGSSGTYPSGTGSHPSSSSEYPSGTGSYPSSTGSHPSSYSSGPTGSYSGTGTGI